MTEILVLSDIHANLEALQAVLDHAQNTHGNPDQIWCLGDIVGYGPDPGPCIDMLRGGHTLTQGVRFHCVKGNHDDGTLSYRGRSRADVAGEAEVQQGWQWTAQALSAEHLEFLEQLPDYFVPPEVPHPVLLVHASPAPNGRLNEYLQVPADVEARIDMLEEQICFFGHTHLACYFVCDTQRKTAQPRLLQRDQESSIEIPLNATVKLFVNPGTVGQPRWGYIDPVSAAGSNPSYQGDQRVSYVWLTLHETGCTMQCHFISYDFTTTVGKLRNLNAANGFKPPERWENRLTKGLR
jgi:predicted phosphodiesterase